MADGSFALALVLLGLTEMAQEDCSDQLLCLPAAHEEPARLAFSGGVILPRKAGEGSEAYVRYDAGRSFGSIGTAYGFSVGNDGALWAGAGLTYDVFGEPDPFFAQLHFMPGLYAPNGGFDLGGLIEFRSGIEFGYETDNGLRIGISYDHKSNGSLFDQNPGIETVQLRVSVPLK